MIGLSGMTPISVSARCCLSIDTLLELCYNNRVIRRYVMKRSLSWLELLWYLPLYIISVYYHLNSVMVLVIVAVGYTISHYHKYTSTIKNPSCLFIQRIPMPPFKSAVSGGFCFLWYAVSISFCTIPQPVSTV